jgi:nitronate monooxygenase
MHDFLRRLGIEHPIVLAPMAGGPGSPELVAAVANAGGLGSIPAAYLSAQDIRKTWSRTRELTDRPLAINVFAGGHHSGPIGDAGPMLAILRDVHARLGIPAPALPPMPPNPLEAQLDVILELKPKVLSFTFGVLDVKRMRDAGIITIGTATTAEEARILEKAGVDAVVAQGSEAGAHRGTFAVPFEKAMVPTLELVEQCVRTISIPVIASGGLMDGGEIAAALDRGAVAAQLGTAFLACPESGASPAYKKAILDATRDTTVITRAFSGRPARGLRNEFIDMVPESAILPFPLQNSLTRPMRNAADPRYYSLWAGQGVTRARSMPAGELVATLVAEISAAERRAS